MPALVLSDRKIVHVDGADAGHFLQNLITANVDGLKPGEARPTALLTPQGKILFDFLISKSGETGYDCDIRADCVDDFIRRLTLYKLRAAVTFEKRDDDAVIAGWGEAAPEGALADRRFPETAGVWRLYGGQASLMDKTGGVDFRKGCYVGQEVVSRMQHRGTARRRVATVTAGTPLPARGADDPELSILAGEKAVGSLGTTEGNTGLAIVRTDRVADALAEGTALTVAGIPVTLTLPSWSGLTFDGGGASAPDA